MTCSTQISEITYYFHKPLFILLKTETKKAKSASEVIETEPQRCLLLGSTAVYLQYTASYDVF